ncbi:GNAT family N-acetyltransferase [Aetokthonos hydrillicola Thurmond2011]|jgi:GNAT superfamily N-acetyltransferase|uniref:GNAT family N-acetyltransferase n=1 Tax=Aetokthonos hydrillicola Thurmond2011 TaxID=2712845 RepID=A0AAP5II39_9CYAN|nr:GNAT family N-acetyltransferase [Aetokthonos hydrillicola]MBO3459972.1 GNAT family N-acetyltransferase [Aetokthonos hydrillicola CCALA 1050]MBW4584091.1 GNAT family N-acetyltransferase [Aetokthonos hydrillicola CCALA 1050]MDR9900733.1 GNAT family N-acetyltransferase [Aetokthonos hydrillicola Thurmond2011]
MALLSRHQAFYYELTTPCGSIIGGVFAVNHWKYIEIVDLFVNKQFQGQGYGRSLLKDVLNSYPHNMICLRCEALGDGLNQDELVAWYQRLEFVDGTPFHEGEGWMHKQPKEDGKRKMEKGVSIISSFFLLAFSLFLQ